MSKDLPTQPLDHPRLFAKKYKLSRQLPFKDKVELWQGEFEAKPFWVYYFPLYSEAAIQAWIRWQEKWERLKSARIARSLVIPHEVQREANQGVIVFPAPKGPFLAIEERGYTELELALLLLDMSQALISLNSLPRYLTVSNSQIYRRSEDGFAFYGWGLEVLYDDLFSPQKFASAAYKAPEQFLDEGSAGTEASIFALGVSLYQLAAAKLPFGSQGGQNLAQRQLSLPELPQYSARFNHILQLMLAKKADRRPSADTLYRLASTFIKEQTWKSVGGLSFNPNLSGSPLADAGPKDATERSPQEKAPQPTTSKAQAEPQTTKKQVVPWFTLVVIMVILGGTGFWWQSRAVDEAANKQIEKKATPHLAEISSLLEARDRFEKLIEEMEAKPNRPPTEITFLRLAQMQLNNLNADLAQKLLFNQGERPTWQTSPNPTWLQESQKQLDRNIQNLEYLR
ncbi:MAG: hypothetical protein AAF927_10485 [Bacteroidota bacterium]